MISKTIQDAINEQINKELFSSYLYLSMSAFFANKSMGGFAQWLRVQEAEEREHAMKFYSYLIDRGGQVTLKAIASPATSWKSNLELFKEVLAHEVQITSSINGLYDLAILEKDYPTQILLQWFVNEQVEEEKNASEIVAQLQLVEERGTAVLMLDHQLGKRGK